MKLLGKIIFAVSLIAAVVYAIYNFYWVRQRQPMERIASKLVEQRKVAERLTFETPEDMEVWEEKTLAPGETEYDLKEVDGVKCVEAISLDSASALYFKQRYSYKGNLFVSWDWKAVKFPGRTKAEDLSDKSEFDFVAQVYVIFHARYYLSAEAIQYVWTEEVPVGTVLNSPYTKKVKILVLQSGPSDTWEHEERDIAQDYEDLFGKELNKDIMAISFMSDADSTDTTASACFANFEIGHYEREADASPAEKTAEKSTGDKPRGKTKTGAQK